MKKNTKLLLALSLVGTTLFACNTQKTSEVLPNLDQTGNLAEQESTMETVTSYSIINASSEFAYLDGIGDKGVPETTYSFRVSLKPGYHFNDKLSITTSTAEVNYETNGVYYTFVMPSSDITITLDVGETDYTITNKSMFIDKVLLDNEDEEEVNVRSAVPGTHLKFEALSNEDFYFTEISLNNEVIEEGDDGYYHFTMPYKPVVISSDKIARVYNINLENTLTLSTVQMYKDADTKEAITSAIKGERVYLHFDYEVIKVRYNIEVKSIVDEGETPVNVEVFESEEEDTFYFDMISANLRITIEEKDCSAFYNHPLANKEWKTWNLYGSSSKKGVQTYESMNGKAFKFEESGDMTYATSTGTWTTISDNHVEYSFSSYTKDVYFTNHLLISKYNDYGSSSWNDAYAGTYSSEYDVNFLVVSSNYRLIWIEDAEGTILENIFVAGESVYTNVTLVTSENVDAKGSDIALDAAFDIKEGNKTLATFNSGSVVTYPELIAVSDEFSTIVLKNEAGEVITSSQSGATVYIYCSLVEGVEEGIVLNDPVVTYGNNSTVSVRAVAGQENVYSFTMPTSATTVKLTTKDMNRYLGYQGLGDYVCYDLYQGSSQDKNYGSTSSFTTWSVLCDGSIKKGSSTYTIDSFENTAEGVIQYTDNGNQANIYYSNGLMVTPYSASANKMSDVYIGIRYPEGVTKDNVYNNVHFNIGGNNTTYAVTYFVNDEVFGSFFCYNGTMYMGVTFTFDEGSTRINSTSSYHVTKDGVTLFDVSENTVTSHL